jgi:hypothetical protein
MGRPAPCPLPHRSPAATGSPTLLAGLVVLLLALGTCVVGWVAGPASASGSPRLGPVSSLAPAVPGRTALGGELPLDEESWLRPAERSGSFDSGPSPEASDATVPPSPRALSGPSATGPDAPAGDRAAGTRDAAPRGPPAGPLPPRARPS